LFGEAKPTKALTDGIREGVAETNAILSNLSQKSLPFSKVKILYWSACKQFNTASHAVQ